MTSPSSTVNQEELNRRAEYANNGRSALIKQWWDLARPKREGVVAAQPDGAREEFFPLFRRWLTARGVADSLVRCSDKKVKGEVWAVFRYAPPEAVVEDEDDWEDAYHGTWWYALWLLLETGIMLESNDKTLGHDFWEPGVYCTPLVETARWYARSTQLFNDGAFHKVMLHLKVDRTRHKKERAKGGIQWVLPSDAVALKAVWVLINSPPQNGDERVREWDPVLEALPPGKDVLPAVLNPRRALEPWPSPSLLASAEAWPVEEETVDAAPPRRKKPKKRPAPIQQVKPNPGLVFEEGSKACSALAAAQASLRRITTGAEAGPVVAKPLLATKPKLSFKPADRVAAVPEQPCAARVYKRLSLTLAKAPASSAGEETAQEPVAKRVYRRLNVVLANA